MAKENKNFFKDEKIILKAKFHWLTIVPSIIFFAAGFILFDMEKHKYIVSTIEYYSGMMPWHKVVFNELPSLIKEEWIQVIGYMFLLWGAISLLVALSRILGWNMYITNMKVIVRKGIFTTSTSELYFNNIESIDVQQSFLGKLFNYGRVYFNATGYGALVFPKVKDPANIKNVALEAIKNSVLGEE